MKKILLIAAMALFGLAPALAQDQDSLPESVLQGQKINKKNLVIKEWKTNGKGAARFLDHMTVYSPEGKKIEEVEYDSGGAQKWRKRFEWGENGKMSRELVYDGHNRLVNYKKFEYNEFGRKKVQYTYDSKGRLTSTKYYEYIVEDV